MPKSIDFSVLTLFPQIIKRCCDYSIIKRAQSKGLLNIKSVDIRKFSLDKHRSVDDHPYGGGVGMILRVDVVEKAISSVSQHGSRKQRIILLDPRAPVLTQEKTRKLANYKHLILVCGHYEGIDDRIKNFVDESLSIGDYILTGGELPALVLIDSVARLIPGVLKKPKATLDESFSNQTLGFPQFTRPKIYRHLKVPDILLSGDHGKILSWRKLQSKKLTKSLRPDLLK